MFQKAIAILVLIVLASVNAGQAQPSNFRSFVPPAWPTLALNANKAPSCVFWTPPVTGAKPEYFCAVIVFATANDADTSLCPTAGGPCAVGALRAVRINPTTGALTGGPAGPSIMLGQDPLNVTCAVIPPAFGFSETTVQCLISATTGAVERVGWDGTKWWSRTVNGDPTGVEGPGLAPSVSVTSNFSCVAWPPANTTCFGIEKGSAPEYWVDQWTRNSTLDFARPSNPLSPSIPGFPGPLACSMTAVASTSFACFLSSGSMLFRIGAAGATNSVGWATSVQTVLTSGVNTGHACVTFPSPTSTPARTDCFFGDGGLIPAPLPFPPCDFGPHGQLLNCKKGPPVGLFWAPDDASRAVEIAMLEPFQLKATPSCIGWTPGQIECFFPNKALSDLVISTETNANIFHVLSYNTDHFATLQREALAAVLLQRGTVLNVGFWQESLGVAAPTTELGKVTIRGHTIVAPVENPKTLTSFACFKGPPFQSLCVAGLIDSSGAPATPATIGAYRASHRLVFKLVGNPNGVAPQEPTPVIKVSGPPGGRLKR